MNLNKEIEEKIEKTQAQLHNIDEKLEKTAMKISTSALEAVQFFSKFGTKEDLNELKAQYHKISVKLIWFIIMAGAFDVIALLRHFGI